MKWWLNLNLLNPRSWTIPIISIMSTMLRNTRAQVMMNIRVLHTPCTGDIPDTTNMQGIIHMIS
jgi:hypothetical protein